MPKRIKLRRFRRGEKKMLFMNLHDRKLPVWIAQRYRIIANVYQHQSVRATTRQLGCAKETAYRCVKEFNMVFVVFSDVPIPRDVQLKSLHDK